MTLGCEITNFYPPNISVTWLKLREGERDDREEEVIEGGEMWGPVQTHPTIYRATATLKRRAINLERTERRGGIICRVELCSLQEPIERQWKNAKYYEGYQKNGIVTYEEIKNALTKTTSFHVTGQHILY